MSRASRRSSRPVPSGQETLGENLMQILLRDPGMLQSLFASLPPLDQLAVAASAAGPSSADAASSSVIPPDNAAPEWVASSLAHAAPGFIAAALSSFAAPSANAPSASPAAPAHGVLPPASSGPGLPSIHQIPASSPSAQLTAENLLSLLGSSFPFHDENREPYLLLDLPASPAAASSAAASSAQNADPATAPAASAPANEPRLSPSLLAAFSAEAGARVLPLRQVRALLTRICRAAFDFAPSEPLLRQAMSILHALALAPGRCCRLHQRFAYAAGACWLDLGDRSGCAVRLAPEGVQLVTPPPVLFRRHPHQLPLPMPLPADGHVNPDTAAPRLPSLRDFLPALSDQDYLLWLAWLTACLNPVFPRPMLSLIGPPGSGKTTLARFSRRLLDPSMLELVPLAGETALAASLARHALPVFDNVSTLTGRQSDLFCRAVTGAGALRRRADGEHVVEPFRLPIILTSLELPSRAPDWLDRALVIPLSIPAAASGAFAWREESVYWSDFAARWPALLSALLDLFCRALGHYQHSFGHRPAARWRMSDFAAWGAAVASALADLCPSDPASGSVYGINGLDGMDCPDGAARFEAALSANYARKCRLAADDDPFAQALLDLLARNDGNWKGSARELYPQLRSTGINNSVALGRLLRRSTPLLHSLGVQISFERRNKERLVVIASCCE